MEKYDYKEFIINQLVMIEIFKRKYNLTNKEILEMKIEQYQNLKRIKNKENEILKNQNIILNLISKDVCKTPDEFIYLKTILEN